VGGGGGLILLLVYSCYVILFLVSQHVWLGPNSFLYIRLCVVWVKEVLYRLLRLINISIHFTVFAWSLTDSSGSRRSWSIHQDSRQSIANQGFYNVYWTRIVAVQEPSWYMYIMFFAPDCLSFTLHSPYQRRDQHDSKAYAGFHPFNDLIRQLITQLFILNFTCYADRQAHIHMQARTCIYSSNKEDTRYYILS
jgi:hypothetical protein